MAASLAADRTKDTADYFGNNARNAVATFVNLTHYSATTNATSSSAGAFGRVDAELGATEKYLRAFGALRLQMSHAYADEIADFQNAGPEAQAGYNLMPPAQPVRYSSDLQPIATKWAARFRADDGVNVGTDVAPVEDAVSRCSADAQNGAYTQCHLDADPTTLPAYAAAKQAIADYQASGRIVPMRFYVIASGAEGSYANALATCASDDGWVDRLPTALDASLLGPVVAGYGGGAQKSIWVADTQDCKWANSGMSYYANPIEGGGPAQTGCDTESFFDGGSRAVICVPQSGPVGKRPDL